MYSKDWRFDAYGEILEYTIRRLEGVAYWMKKILKRFMILLIQRLRRNGKQMLGVKVETQERILG